MGHDQEEDCKVCIVMKFPDYDIIMLALPRWDGPYSSTAFCMAKALSMHTRVFYVDNPITLKDYIVNRNLANYQRRKKALFHGDDIFTSPDPDSPNLFAVTPRVTLPINWLPRSWVYDALAKVNDAALASTLNQLLELFKIERYILINSFNPLYGRNMSLIRKPLLSIYHCVDDITQAPYMRKHGSRLEKELIKRADFTVVTSSELRRRKARVKKEVHLIPNAADVQLFRKALDTELPVPPEIADIRPDTKVILYTGNICHRLDYRLLMKLALVHNDKVFLMVGPVTGKYCLASGLRRLRNVIFTGRKPIEQLPAYLRHSDCCIIPFLCNTFTKSIYPLKINEYLSAGKPVVSTAFSDDICDFSSVVHICRSHAEFISAVETAVQKDSALQRTMRAAFSAGNDWTVRAHQFIDLTLEYLKRHDGRGGRRERGEGVQTLYG